MPRRKVWPLLVAVLVEHHARGEAGPLLALPAASTGRWRCAPAASARRGRGSRPSCRAAAPRGRAGVPGPHVVGDVGDGDVHDEAAAVLRVGVGRGVDGIVVVARIDGIDGEEGEIAQVGAACERRRLELCTSASTAAGNSSGMPCACTAIRLILRWSCGIAERLDDARLRHAVAVRARQLEADEIAVLGRALVARRDRPFLAAPCGRRDR